MKKLFIIALAALCAAPAMADEAKNEEKKDTLIFTPVIQNRVTSIKNQNNSGTCWAYSALYILCRIVRIFYPKTSCSCRHQLHQTHCADS